MHLSGILFVYIDLLPLPTLLRSII